MRKTLRQNEMCPLHRTHHCDCLRVPDSYKESSLRFKVIAPGVKLYPDGRIVRTESAMKRLKDEMLQTEKECYGCGEPFSDYAQVELGHIASKGMSGFKRDDRKQNVKLIHRSLNSACGSRDLDDFIEYLRSSNKPLPCEVEE